MLYSEDVPETGLVLDHHDVHLALHAGPGGVLHTEAGADAGSQTPANIRCQSGGCGSGVEIING